MQVAEEKVITDAKDMITNIHQECDRFANMVELTDKLALAYQNLSEKNISHPNIS